MSSRRCVLVTGLGGVIGTAIRPALEARYELRALSRRGVEGLPDERVFRADIADGDTIQGAFAGVDTVVHLAAEGVAHRSDGETGWHALLHTNIVGTYNVFKAARENGVRRVVFASSGGTVEGYEKDAPYADLVRGVPAGPPGSWPMLAPDCPPRPLTLYAVTKLFGEALGRYHAETSPLSVLCLRIGSVTPDDRPKPGRGRAIYCSHRDLARMIVLCIEAPETLRYHVLFVTSRNRLGFRDLEPARRLLGFVPEDGA